MPAGVLRPEPGPCAKVVLGIFGSLFLIALLSVPVTTRISQLRQDPESKVVIRTTYPWNTTMFLPRYLSVTAHASKTGDIEVRSTPWIGTTAIIAVLGVFDYIVFCRLMRRRRRAPEGP